MILLPVARTGSRSRTCRSDISLGNFWYISCLVWTKNRNYNVNITPKVTEESTDQAPTNSIIQK